MKLLLMRLLIVLTVLAGASKCNAGGNDENQNGTMIGTTLMLNARQLDSLRVADGLEGDLQDWIKATFRDYETGQYFVKYTYIKELTDSTEMIYVITQKDSLYKVVKRQVTVEEE